MIVPLFLSGAASLIAELCWLRTLIPILGGTASALNVTLIVFLGGIGIGASLAGKVLQRNTHWVLIYVMLEALLATYMFCSPFLFSYVGALAQDLLIRTGFESFWEQLLRSLVCGVVLIPPTVAMGMTTPIVVVGTSRGPSSSGFSSGILYGVNCLGGASGALLAGCVLILKLGISTTLSLAGGVDVAAAMLTLIVFAGCSHPGVFRPNGRNGIGRENARTQSYGMLATLSGFLGMAMELVLTRMMRFLVGGSYFAHTIILSGFISGLVVGSLLFAVFSRRRRLSREYVSALFAIMGGSILASIGLLWFGPAWLQAKVVPYFSSNASPFLLKFTVAFLTTLLPAATSGAILPLLVELSSVSTGNVASSSSRIFTYNTVGSVIGILVIGYVVILNLGVRNTAFALACLAFAGALVADHSSKVLAGMMVGAIVVTAGLAMRYGSVPLVVHSFAYNQLHDPPILYYSEDQHAGVSVLEMDGSRALMVNNMMESRLMPNNVDDIGGLSDVAIASHVAPKTMLVAGLGAGRTAGVAALYSPLVVDFVEISPSVITALPFFDAFTYNASRNPRLKSTAGDARHFLQITARKYDLIVADVFTSAVTGTSYLYNREFFALCRDRLRPGGRVVIQVDLDGTAEFYRTIDRVVAKTFLSALPDVVLVRMPRSGNTYLIGATEVIHPPERPAVVDMGNPLIKERWIHLGLDGGISGCVIVSRDILEHKLQNDAISTDDHPVVDSIQFRAPENFLAW